MFQLQGAEWLAALFLGGLIVSLLIAPYFVAKSAREKGRSFGAWYAITAVLGVSLCFVGWIIAAITVATMKPEASSHTAALPGSVPAPPSIPASPSQSEQTVPRNVPPPRPTKRCPACAEDVLADARKCKHCGEDVTETIDGPPPQTPP